MPQGCGARTARSVSHGAAGVPQRAAPVRRCGDPHPGRGALA